MTSSDDKIPTNAAQNSLIEMQSVCLDIEGNRVLKNVSFATKSRRLGIIGRNGSGKSTLSRVLSGLIEIQSGKLEVAGFDPYKNRGAAVAQIGILFQNPDHQIIFPTVIEELVFGLRQQGQSKAEAKSNALNILAKFGKTHWQDVHTASLSQGQKHLVCLMSIVAMQPKLIILDEPFAGLDIPTKRQLQRYLDSFDGCLVHISHDPADIEHYDQILWLESGQIEEVGTPNAVLPNYLAEMNRLGDSDDISNLTN